MLFVTMYLPLPIHARMRTYIGIHAGLMNQWLIHFHSLLSAFHPRSSSKPKRLISSGTSFRHLQETGIHSHACTTTNACRTTWITACSYGISCASLKEGGDKSCPACLRDENSSRSFASSDGCGTHASRSEPSINANLHSVSTAITV